MKIPSNLTEQELLAAIDKVVNRLAPNFKFSYFTLDDIKQEGRRIAWEGLVNYDETRPIENFLYAHVRNRLINFIRDNYRRNDPPCYLCYNSYPYSQHPDGAYCESYLNWQKNQTAKHNIMNPVDISNICDEKETHAHIKSSVQEDVETAEILEIIDSRLPIELRATYLQMRHGAKVPKAKRLEVERVVKKILKDTLCQHSVSGGDSI